MTPNRNDERFLDRIIDSVLKQPISDGPPDEVRRRILSLGEPVLHPAPVSRLSYRWLLADWISMAAVAVTLLVALDLGWCIYVNSATPVSWFRDADTDNWRVMYDDTRVEIRQPPAEIRRQL